MKESTKMFLKAIKSLKMELEYENLTPSQKEEWKEMIRASEKCVINDIGLEAYKYYR